MTSASIRDGRVLCVSAFVRSIATSATGVLFGLHLGRLGLAHGEVGFVVAAGLAGGAAAALLVTLASRAPRRPTLVVLAALSGAGTLAVSLASGVGLVAAFAFLGMVNGMGRDRGAAMVLESAILPATVASEKRTNAFAWYHLLQDLGHALGALFAGLPEILRRWAHAGDLESLRVTLAACALLAFLPALLAFFLSQGVETKVEEGGGRLSASGRRVIGKISALFFVDSLAGGLLTTALLSYFFFERFAAGVGVVALLFVGARILNALSHLAAAWLARRIGLLNTMVFTHVPSSLLLATAVIAPDFPVAAALFLLREGLVEMDVPTRQSYVMAVVRPSERVMASGATHLVRMAGWAAGPWLAGLLLQGAPLAVPFLAGAGLKIVYDGLLFAAFRRLKPPEERDDPRQGESS